MQCLSSLYGFCHFHWSRGKPLQNWQALNTDWCASCSTPERLTIQVYIRMWMFDYGFQSNRSIWNVWETNIYIEEKERFRFYQNCMCPRFYSLREKKEYERMWILEFGHHDVKSIWDLKIWFKFVLDPKVVKCSVQSFMHKDWSDLKIWKERFMLLDRIWLKCFSVWN